MIGAIIFFLLQGIFTGAMIGILIMMVANGKNTNDT